eukprot:scpid106429/ scgid10778/ 
MENCLSGVERTARLDSLGQSVREYTPALLLEGFRLTARPGHGYHERETCRHKGPTDKQQELENKRARPLSRTTPTAKASHFRQSTPQHKAKCSDVLQAQVQHANMACNTGPQTYK